MKKMWKNLRIAVVLLIIGFLFFSTTAVIAENNVTSKIYDNEQIDTQPLIKNRDVLKRNHILPILKGYFFIENTQIKQIIKDILFNIFFTGDATVDEILDILDSHNVTVKNIYLFAEIETSDNTDGSLSCFPGQIRTYFGGYNAKGSYVMYEKSYELPLYGWHLKINGEGVTRDPGYFFGYYGHIRQMCEWHKPNIYYDFFTLDGYAILVFQGV